MYTQNSHKLWPNLAPVDRGTKKLVMDKGSSDFSEDLVRTLEIGHVFYIYGVILEYDKA